MKIPKYIDELLDRRAKVEYLKYLCQKRGISLNN